LAQHPFTRTRAVGRAGGIARGAAGADLKAVAALWPRVP
jgi:hypothetical protein